MTVSEVKTLDGAVDTPAVEIIPTGGFIDQLTPDQCCCFLNGRRERLCARRAPRLTVDGLTDSAKLPEEL